MPLLFGRFLMKSGWASAAEVQRATQLQRELIPCPGLAAALLGMLSLDALRQTLAHQRRTGQLFQEAVRELGFLDDTQLAALDTQRRAALLPLGEAKVRQGSLTKEDLQDVLQAFAHYKKTEELSPLQDMFMVSEREYAQ
jgi:hypothetical protein